METVFITIHDLSLDARIKYASDSVEDILGYQPHEVKGKSCWEYFHPDEIPFARAIHGRGIHLDKASALNYCQIKHKDGSWVGCECVFTVVYDVLVASTSIYRRGPRSRQRAIDGASVRRIFSSSPRDPRYHMLSYISSKFYQEPTPHSHEPRAALFLNRFTRTSTVMFATPSVASILSLRPDQLVGKSFYSCITENCLQDAVRCIESAKANDSIAYLRFWYCDRIQDDQSGREVSMVTHSSDDEDEEGGVTIQAEVAKTEQVDQPTASVETPTPVTDAHALPVPPALEHKNSDSHGSSGNSTDLDGEAIFDPPVRRRSSSLTPSEDHHEDAGRVEIEAVVSCTSDGLVVILRRARPLAPHVGEADVPYYANGLFASPWATEPVMPENAPATIPPEAADPPGTEPEPASFMSAIREVAVFAWSLTGINGSIAQYGNGSPLGESLPPDMPIWDPKSNADPENKYNGFATSTHRPIDRGNRDFDETTSSEDEVVWKRVPNPPAWRRPARRGREEAFGSDEDQSKVDMGNERATRRRKFRLGE